jgi:uncharacterized protein (DUF1778 family)
MVKTAQLQIRLSTDEKERLRGAARRAGMDVSRYVLSLVLPDEVRRFQELVRAIAGNPGSTYELAALHDSLAGEEAEGLARAVRNAPHAPLEPLWANYVAAMVETASVQRSLAPPAWVHDVRPLSDPWFASELHSLRLHLLTASPPAFRRRNLFVDSAVGDRV